MSDTVLLVDHLPGDLEAINTHLTKSGYEVTTASNGKEALEKIKVITPDIVLTEVEMPEMDGIDLYQQLRGNVSTSKIPIVIMTDQVQMEANFRKLGVNGFVKKPVEMESLTAQVQTCLQARPDTQTQAAAPQDVPAPTQAPVSTPTKVQEPEPKIATKTVLLGEKVGSVIDQIKETFAEDPVNVVVVSKESDVINKVKESKPDVLVINMLIDKLPTNNVIRFLRKAKEYKDLPIVAYNFFDEESFKDVSSHQVKFQVENAKVSCMNADPTIFLEKFDENAIIAEIKKHIG